MMAASMLTAGGEGQSLIEGPPSPLIFIDNKIAKRNSMLYNVLPMVVQSRIPSLPSLRRSVSQFRTHGTQHRKSSSSRSGEEMQRPVTPPPEYRSREGSGSNTPVRQPSLAMTSVGHTSAEDEDVAAQEMMEEYRRTLPSSYEATSGVNWSFARQGLSMVNSARHFAKDSLKNDADAGNTLVRTLYIDGLRYLLSGLPSDLTPNEIKGLQASMPDTLVKGQGEEGVLVPRSQQEVMAEGPPTLLHRAIAWTVCYAMLLMTFIMPYIRLLLGYAYQYEKEHRVGRRLLESSTVTADRLGRRGLQTAQTIFQWNDGMVGDAVNRAVVYGTAGVSGGLRQGIEDAYRAGAFRERKLKTEN